jgi:predicted permease
MNLVFLQLALIVVAGILYRRIPNALPPEEIRRVISSIVLNVFIPFLTFGVIATAPMGMDLLTVPVISITTALLGLGLGWLVYARLLRGRLSSPAAGSLILAATWCNAMYMGLPITTSVIGEHVSRVPILYDYLGMTPLLFTLGALIGSRFGAGQVKTSVSRGLTDVFTMPPTITIAAALVVNALDVAIPEWVTSACLSAGKVVAPLMLFSIGLALRLPSWRSIPILMPSVAIRVIIVPALVLPLTGLIIHDADVRLATMLESAMPTMMLTMVFAEKYGLDESVLAQAILLSTLVSALTLPMLPALL